jgi:hypothetical protein
MARYAPLPSVSIDPRNEAELVQAASQRVYQASGQTLNDFSAGNPLAALLEGQAFAQGEFLFWANQLPQSILIEWLGPFLGAMRRLGTPAIARLTLTVPPSDTITVISAGTAFSTDPNLTAGESYTFVTDAEVSIPAGETVAYVSVASQYVGAIYNAPANSITGTSAINVNGLTSTNVQPAAGGSDVETYQEVQERFFTLIRRRNPVSAEDWQDFFTDFYGIGTQTSVQPNRPNQGTYNYVTDYLKPNGQVSFFVLGPNGVELNQAQLERGQNVINYSVPVENQGHLYPITLSQVQYNLSVEVDANGSFGVNLRDSSLNFRDRLFSILTPGNVFPPTTDPTVSDVDAAFYTTFTPSTRFVDPHIEVSAAYNTPPLLDPAAATYTKVYTFEPTGTLLDQHDLVETSLPVPIYYPVESAFTPYSTAKKDQTIYGNLVLQQITFLVPGDYLQGQVCYWNPADGGDAELHVITENLTIGSQAEIPELLRRGKISAAKTYTPWVVGTTYQETTSGGFYDPDLIEYEYDGPITNGVSADGQFVPDPDSIIPLNKRPGAFVWVAGQNFTLEPATNDITGAQNEFKLGAPVVPVMLEVGGTYAAGTWVFTPQVGSGPDPVADPYYNYVDVRLGVVNKYAYVVETFTYLPEGKTTSSYFDELVEQKIVEEVVVQNGDNGLPVAKYNPRFPAGTYLSCKVDTEIFCVEDANGCFPVELPGYRYYIAAKYFTPTSTNPQDLIDQGLIFPLTTNDSQLVEFVNALNTPGSGILQPTRMFRFFKGDRTFFRQGSQVISYTATTNVHPLFEFYIYLENGIFVETERFLPAQFESQDYVPYFDPSYVLYSEDTVIAEDGRNLYRVMLAFTPPETVVNWTNTTVANTARYEEFVPHDTGREGSGNLLRYVDQYVCEEDILSQFGRDISAIKLGVAQITMIPKNSGRYSNSRNNEVYVWENTATITEVPQLSWYSGTAFPYTPPNYGTGTMKL